MRIYKEGDIVLGSWKLVRILGQGSFGTVYEAHREDFGILYKAAIKIISVPYSQSEIASARAEGMDEESITAYFRSVVQDIIGEFGLMSRLKGTANVVSYEDHAVIPQGNGIGWDIIIRMELLTPMLDHMSTHSMTRMDIIQLGIDMCKTLELCQRYNIIHRDIKPENMFISELGDYKIGDFGIARTLEKTAGGLSKKGTYTYMAPEVYKEEPYGSNVDIYSLGIVMYRLLNNNRAPFLPDPPAAISHGDREKALLKRIAGNPLPKPANSEGRLTEIVLKACAYDPADRYSSPVQMRQELESIAYKRTEDHIVNCGQKAIEISKTDFKSMDPGDRTELGENTSLMDDITVVKDKTADAAGGDGAKSVSIDKVERKRKFSKILLPIATMWIAILFMFLSFGQEDDKLDEVAEYGENNTVILRETTVPESTTEEAIIEATNATSIMTTMATEGITSLYPDLEIDDEGFVVVENSGVSEDVLCVLGYKVSDDSVIKYPNVYITGKSTAVNFSWEKEDAVTKTQIANWKAEDFSDGEIASQKNMMLSIWKSEGMVTSAVSEASVHTSFPVVPSQNCYVLLLSMDKEMNILKHTVIKLGYVTNEA